MGEKEKILIKSSTGNLHLIRDFVEKKAAELGIDSKVISQIIISVDEACTNVIKHTHKYNDTNEIEVETVYKNKEFAVIIRYAGEAFDPTKKETPDMKEYFKKFKVGGLGIPIMKKSMDKIEFKHTKPNKNSLTLIKVI
ncbi:MAG: ATP-binding protein [Bacteroidetes bacterium]|nr:ATP-binding protein [Bacteroidota bacterium]